MQLGLVLHLTQPRFLPVTPLTPAHSQLHGFNKHSREFHFPSIHNHLQKFIAQNSGEILTALCFTFNIALVLWLCYLLPSPPHRMTFSMVLTHIRHVIASILILLSLAWLPYTSHNPLEFLRFRPHRDVCYRFANKLCVWNAWPWWIQVRIDWQSKTVSESQRVIYNTSKQLLIFDSNN